MAQVSLIGRERYLKRWQTLRQNLSKKNRHSVIWLHVTGAAGVGRSYLIQNFNKKLKQIEKLIEISCNEGPILTKLRRRLPKIPPGRKVLLILRDLHELEEGEAVPLGNFLRTLAAAGGPLLIVLEYRKGGLGLRLSKAKGEVERWELKPFLPREVGLWLRRTTGMRRLPAELIKKFYQRTRGLPLEMQLWAPVARSESPKKWPKDRARLIQTLLDGLGAEPLHLLGVWGLHPSWAKSADLSKVSGVKAGKVQSHLKKFQQWGWVEPSLSAPRRYRLRVPEIGEASVARLSPEARKKHHRLWFEHIHKQKEWLYRETWLAYHASQGSLGARALCWNILAGESYEARGQLENSQAYFRYALELAPTDFARSYVSGVLAETLMQQKKIPEAIGTLGQALKWAEQVPWPELIQNLSLSMGQLLSHVGRYRGAEVHFHRALEMIKERDLQEERIKVLPSLGVSYLEQARYAEAEKVYSEIFRYWETQSDPWALTGAQMSLLQIHIALGRVADATRLMDEIYRKLRELPENLWRPLFQLLIAKFYTTQGRLGMALRILQEAAKGFEANGNLHGKVEVLLAMSAPMLEYGLIGEAQNIIDLLGAWTELSQFPALQHSVRLRRMAVSAFSGKWVEEDFALAGQSALDLGRTEDWLIFWFHLALASQGFDDPKFFRFFIGKARDLAQTVAARLDASSAKSFLLRPDVARIFRLSEAGKGKAAAVLSAREQMEMEGPADAASMAPPLRGPGKSEE